MPAERFAVAGIASQQSLERLLREGRQAYVVCPLVEGSQKLEAPGTGPP